MPVNRKLKILYLHPPKTGGTSISAMFGGSIEDLGNWPCVAEHAERLEGVWHSSMPLSYYELFIPQKDVEEYFKFITVRNPFTRAVSDFLWRSPQDLPGFSRNQTTADTFYYYLRGVEATLNKYSMDEILKPYSTSPRFTNHWIPQHEYIKCEGIDEKDITVVRLENFREDFETKVNKVCGLNLKVLHRNRRKQTHRGIDGAFYIGKHRLTGRKRRGKFESCASIVTRIYREDFVTFNYSTNPEDI